MIEYHELAVSLLVLLLLAGLALLTLGGDSLARGAASLALLLELNPVVVGLTVVAIATSLPELVTGLIAVWDGEDDLAIGNIVGSNLANIGLILGISAIIFPLSIQARLLRKEVPILLGVSALFAYFCYNGITRWEGGILLAGTLAYLFFVTRQAGKLPPEEAREFSPDLKNPVKSIPRCLFYVALGGFFLWLGAELLINSAAVLAEKAGVSKLIVGLTIVAVGTSLPELAASAAAAVRRQSDIIAGNIVGSNIFNILLIGGGVGTGFTLDVQHSLFYLELPGMLAFTALLWYIFSTHRKVKRGEGMVLLVFYLVLVLASTLQPWGPS